MLLFCWFYLQNSTWTQPPSASLLPLGPHPFLPGQLQEHRLGLSTTYLPSLHFIYFTVTPVIFLKRALDFAASKLKIITPGSDIYGALSNFQAPSSILCI